MMQIRVNRFLSSLGPRPVVSDRRHEREADGADDKLSEKAVVSRLQNERCKE